MSTRTKLWLLAHLGTGGGTQLRTSDVGSLYSTGSFVPPLDPTFHLLTESGDFIVTEASDFLDIEH